jgi:glucokinase
MGKNAAMILAGDIGGTTTRLAAFELAHGTLLVVAEKDYPSREHGGLGDIVEHFVAAHALRPACACFGIAGPVRDARVKTPNLPWVIEASALARQLGLAAVSLINDLEANAWGIGALGPDDVRILNTGAPAALGNAGVIAAGTGLGQAGLFWDGERHRPFSCEGGHADFAPRNALEAELLRHLTGRFGHVSYERVLSGPGLGHIYEFLRDTGRGAETPAVVEAMRDQDIAAVIARAALERRCGLCVDALELFVSIYGAEAGNVGLKFMAVAGVYVGGGIAPKIVGKLQEGAFMRAFVAKGRMQPLLESMPVRVILNPKTALLGAARYAALRTGLLR